MAKHQSSQSLNSQESLAKVASVSATWCNECKKFRNVHIWLNDGSTNNPIPICYGCARRMNLDESEKINVYHDLKQPEKKPPSVGNTAGSTARNIIENPSSLPAGGATKKLEGAELAGEQSPQHAQLTSRKEIIAFKKLILETLHSAPKSIHELLVLSAPKYSKNTLQYALRLLLKEEKIISCVSRSKNIDTKGRCNWYAVTGDEERLEKAVASPVVTAILQEIAIKPMTATELCDRLSGYKRGAISTLLGRLTKRNELIATGGGHHRVYALPTARLEMEEAARLLVNPTQARILEVIKQHPDCCQQKISEQIDQITERNFRENLKELVEKQIIVEIEMEVIDKKTNKTVFCKIYRLL